MSAALDVATRGTTSASRGPTPKSLGKSALVWIIIAALLLFAGAAITLSQVDEEESRYFHYYSFRADGAHAYAQMMRDHGANLKTTEDFADAKKAAAHPGATVIVLRSEELSESGAKELGDAAAQGGTVVLMGPVSPEDTGANLESAHTFDDPDTDKPLTPECSFPAAQRAGDLVLTGLSYYSTEPNAQLCYPHDTLGKQASQLAAVPHGKGMVIAVGDEFIAQNQYIADDGNASLMLGLASGADEVVVYWADWEEFEDPADFQSLTDFLPKWVFYFALWALVMILVVILWRGRRFGPLAVESLPVVVPAKETVIGYAGLMQSARARGEALRSLQQAAIISLARELSLPVSTPAEEVCTAVAVKLGENPHRITHLLLEAQPRTDAELVSLAQAVNELERRL